MTYPGGKAGSGVYQALINMMPPHVLYVEAFLGAGAVMRYKKPAAYNVGIDLDESPIANFDAPISGLSLWQTDAIHWLADQNFSPDALVYCDPPYLMETRKTKQARYKYEFTRQQHINLLGVLIQLNCMVMISGYHSSLYLEHLRNWRVETFQATTRSGHSATECVWLNFDPPFELHDYRYLDSDYRERERVKRKKTRWVNRLQKQPTLERMALLAAIEEVRPGQVMPELTMPAATTSYADTRSLLHAPSLQLPLWDPASKS